LPVIEAAYTCYSNFLSPADSAIGGSDRDVDLDLLRKKRGIWASKRTFAPNARDR